MDEDSTVCRRDVSEFVVARVGRVVSTGDPVLPWAVLDGAGEPVEPVTEFLRDLLACGSSAASCRSYGFDLLRWFRFLAAVARVAPRAARRGPGLRAVAADVPQPCPRPSSPRCARGGFGEPAYWQDVSAGGLRAGDDQPCAVGDGRVLQFHLGSGQGPVVSPVPPQSRDGRRLHAHHNPLEPFRLHRRGVYRQKQPDPHHGRSPTRSGGPVRGAGLQPGPGDVPHVPVQRRPRRGAARDDRGRRPAWRRPHLRAAKGLGGVKQACPASPEAFSWLALYLAELAPEGHRPDPDEPLWWTRRRPLRPLTYTALRAVLSRINERIGANVTLTTCGIRCACGWSPTRTSAWWTPSR